MKIKRIAIVGGGNGGWLAANHLGSELSRRPDIEITLIESKDIPVIGVGEGTVPLIRRCLKKFGITELDLLMRCDATFKTAIKFIDWTSSKKGIKDNFYYHPFNVPYPGGLDVTAFWLKNKKIASFSELSLVHQVSEQNRSPKHKSSPPYEGVVNYAYHFDAAKFAALLSENAVKRFGVKHIYETVDRVLMHEDGYIKGLVYNSGKSEEFDFYIDCSGFSGLLIGDALKVPFVSKSKQILTDSALALQIPTRSDEEIFPYTKATAHGAGWIWDIPLTTRRGTGIVYSSEHMSDNEALEAFSKYHQLNLESKDVKKISMKTGYREKFWEKNCVALGLAQGFVEPLEATSIMATDFSASLIAKMFPIEKGDIPLYSKRCNERVQLLWERIIDFIQLHYFISDRRDTRFWRDVTENKVMSDVLIERLDLWKLSIPQPTDFISSLDFFHVESYLFILYGMNYPTRPYDVNVAAADIARDKILMHLKKAHQIANSLTSQRAWFNEVKDFATRNNLI